MLRNSSGVCSKLADEMVAVKSCLPSVGCWAMPPAETWAFWAEMAALTSLGLSLYFTILLGSSQMRMAYSEPNTSASPTPCTRESGS